MARSKQEKKADDDIVKECQEGFERCEERESYTRPLWKEDLRFANGDPDNGFQWDDEMSKKRQAEKRPCLTINKVKQHNRQITNDARQNKSSVRVYPVDDGADKQTAEIFNGIIRHIEANSSADTAYDIAGEFAVDAGLGYWRITTDYAADDTFDQEIYIKAIPNPLNVYLGGYTEFDGSDATTGYIFTDMPRHEYEAKYPDAEPAGWPSDVGSSWLGKDTIRICEYFKIVAENDTLVALPDGTTGKLSEIEDKEVVKAIKADESIKKRKVSVRKCKWYLIAGDQILERRDWLGKYIPIVRVVGEEIEIDGKIDRKGHTRAMKDAQRMYNFWTTAAVEFVALQGKQPYLAEAAAIQGYETYWNNLNSQNLPYLPYNGRDSAGNPIQKPERQQPPVMAPAYMQGMQVASEEMKMASGQYDASMGAKSNETSGRAITARQRESDNATFHFADNEARAKRYTGKILVDLIPKVYDTERVVRILGEDGKEDKATIDPNQPQSVVEKRDGLTGEIKKIYNPSVGRYDVVVAVGPSYGTKRQEAFQALTEMSSRNPELMQIAGDLVMKAADFPMAEQLAERYEKTLAPGLKDDDGKQKPNPELMQAQEQIKQLSGALENAFNEVQQLEDKQQASDGDQAIKRVDSNTKAYQAITQRLQVIGSLLSAQELQVLAEETKREAMEQPDPGRPPAESMSVPEDAVTEQPADAGFLTP